MPSEVAQYTAAQQTDIYAALNGLVSAQRDLIAMLRATINDWERREEELRDAHLDLANALNRRMDELHSRIDEIASTDSRLGWASSPR